MDRESTDSRVLYLRSNFRTSPFTLDIYSPVYGQALPPITIPRNNIERITNTGLYAQDEIVLSPEWRAQDGVRLDNFEQSFRERIPRSETDQSRDAASPRAGLVYRPIPELAFYTNVGTSFRPNIGPDAAAVTRGTALPPETGLGYEVGAKSELFGGNLLLTAAAFHVERENVLTPDPANSGFSLAAGAVRSQGFELTAQGQITPELKLLAGYVYADARVTKDNVLAGDPALYRHTPAAVPVSRRDRRPHCDTQPVAGAPHRRQHSPDPQGGTMSGWRFLPLLRIELRLILREWLTWAVLAALLAALCLGASTGARRVAAERAAIAQAVEDSARSRREAKETAARYAGPSGVKINYWQDPTHAFGYMHYFLTAYAVKPPTPLALLSAGQSEIQPSVMKTSFGFSTVFEDTAYDLTSSAALRLGPFDLAFVLVYLVPLAVIAVAGTRLAAEQDTGIVRLIAA